MVALNDFGPDVRRVPHALSSLGFGIAVQLHDVLVIGRDQFLPPARDIIWDCRGFATGLPAVPMDFDAPVNSDLSSPYIQRVLEFWPDQELLGFLIDGVDFRADLPLQIVLGPQLVSLSKAYPNAQKEIIGCMVWDTKIFTTAFPFFQFETFLKGPHLESMKSAEIAAPLMVAILAKQPVTKLVYVLFL